PEHGYCEGGRFSGLPYDPVLSTDEGRSWYDALDVTFEKSWSEASKWAFTMAYTFADAYRKGSDFFTLDFPGIDPANWPKVRARIEKHHLVASGLVGLPFDIRMGALVQWGSGLPYSRKDETIGWGPARVQVDFNSEDSPNFRQVDLGVEKAVAVPGRGKVGVLAEVINLFDHENFRGYEELFKFGGGAENQNFAKPLTWTADTGRRLQLGLNFEF
ncbi:MAG TPA: hypothetical protein VK864_10990, partial [Longimicrobiales bacterium]|nr:hypothetical protein [Longimicrobiales bacterium]